MRRMIINLNNDYAIVIEPTEDEEKVMVSYGKDKGNEIYIEEKVIFGLQEKVNLKKER